jgi:hypothetical protein
MMATMSRPLILRNGDLAQLADTDALQLPTRAIAAGASTPDPGIDGVVIYSSVEEALLVWSDTDSMWNELSGAGGGDSADEVWIGGSPPPDDTTDLWVDTDEDPPALTFTYVLILMEGDEVPPDTVPGTIVIIVPA